MIFAHFILLVACLNANERSTRNNDGHFDGLSRSRTNSSYFTARFRNPLVAGRALITDWSVSSFIIVVHKIFSSVRIFCTTLKNSCREPLQNYLRTSQMWVFFLQGVAAEESNLDLAGLVMLYAHKPKPRGLLLKAKALMVCWHKTKGKPRLSPKSTNYTFSVGQHVWAIWTILTSHRPPFPSTQKGRRQMEYLFVHAPELHMVIDVLCNPGGGIQVR